MIVTVINSASENSWITEKHEKELEIKPGMCQPQQTLHWLNWDLVDMIITPANPTPHQEIRLLKGFPGDLSNSIAFLPAYFLKSWVTEERKGFIVMQTFLENAKKLV